MESKKRTHRISPDRVEGQKRILFLLYQILQQVFALVQDDLAHWMGTDGTKLEFWKVIPAQQTFPANSWVREGPSITKNANWECGGIGIWFPALPHTSRVPGAFCLQMGLVLSCK